MIAAALVVLALAAPSRADQLFLNSGAELVGTVTAIDASSVRLRDASGSEKTYPRAEVLRVKLIKRYGVPGEEQPGRVADPAVRELLRRPPEPEAYPDDGVLRALDEATCRLDEKAASVCVHHEVDYVLRERGKDDAADQRYRWLSGVKTGRIAWARSITPSRVADLDDTSVQEGSEYAGWPEYDKLRSVKFAVPEVATGAVVDYAFERIQPVSLSTYPYFGQTPLRGTEPLGTARAVVDAPASLALKWATRGLPDGAFRRELSGGRQRLIWEARGVPSFKREPQMPPLGRLAPYATYGVEDTWEGVADKAYAALAPALAEDPSVTALAKRLVAAAQAGHADPVEALYAWVTRGIKFESVLMDEFGYVPRPPAATIEAKGGNALDKPFVLFALLRAAGYDPSLVYVVPRTETPLVREVPSLRQLSVAVVRLETGGRALFLAPIEDSRRYDETGGWLQGCPGLVVAGPGKGTFVETPVADAGRESFRETLTLSLAADGTLRGRSARAVRGGYQAGWRELKDLAKDDLRRNFEERVHWIHPQARLQSFTLARLDDLTRDLDVRYAFVAPGYALAASGGFLAFRVPYAEHPASEVGAPTRESPLFWWERDLQERRARIALPPGYGVYFAPAPAELSGPGSAYSARYDYDAAANTLTFTESLRRDVRELPPSDYAAYKAFREKVARFGEQWIVLRAASLIGAARAPKKP